jgi:hypothetical protein
VRHIVLIRLLILDDSYAVLLIKVSVQLL